jgi:hypothetical protein
MSPKDEEVGLVWKLVNTDQMRKQIGTAIFKGLKSRGTGLKDDSLCT